MALCDAARLFFDRFVRGTAPVEAGLEEVGLRMERRVPQSLDDKGGTPPAATGTTCAPAGWGPRSRPGRSSRCGRCGRGAGLEGWALRRRRDSWPSRASGWTAPRSGTGCGRWDRAAALDSPCSGATSSSRWRWRSGSRPRGGLARAGGGPLAGPAGGLPRLDRCGAPVTGRL